MAYHDPAAARLQQTPANVSASAGGEFASAPDGGLSSPSRSAGSASLPPVTTEPRTTLTTESSFKPSLSSSSGGGSHVTDSNPSALGLGGSSSSTSDPVNAHSGTQDGSTVPGRAAETIESTVTEQAHQSGLVAPQQKSDMNEATKHVDNLATGIAGIALTAPLAAIEKVSPVLAEKVQAGVEQAKATLSSATSSAASTVQGHTQGGQGQGQGVVAGAQQTAQNAFETVKGYLPTALGGRPADTTTPSTTSSSGPNLTERATSAAAATKDPVASTAQAYLPASIVGGQKTTDSTSSSSATESPYVDRQDVKPTSTISPSDVTRSATGGSDELASRGTSSSTDKPGLAPASFSSPNTGRDSVVESGSQDFKHPSSGAPMYTGSQAGSVDYKKDQSDFTPGEFAGIKHREMTYETEPSTSTGSGRGVGPDSRTKPAQDVSSSSGGLGSTAGSDVPSSLVESAQRSADPKSGAAGAQTYTGSQAGSADHKKDQNDSTPGEFAGIKHREMTYERDTSTSTGSGRGVGPDPETKPAQDFLSSGGGLGSTAESDVPSSSIGSGQPSADPKSGAAALSDSSRATETTTDPTFQKTGIKAKLNKLFH
ncbi:hypothetical protein ACM66B_003939 [Microbotryomycetes sp. NB124-2]